MLLVFIVLTTNRCSARKFNRSLKKDRWGRRKWGRRTSRMARRIPGRCSNRYRRRCRCIYWEGKCYPFCRNSVRRTCNVG